jgi:hypothetical protein
MSPPGFLDGLEAELRLRGVAFSRADVLAFADDVWPLAQEDPDPVRWADAFVEAGYAAGAGEAKRVSGWQTSYRGRSLAYRGASQSGSRFWLCLSCGEREKLCGLRGRRLVAKDAAVVHAAAAR